MNDTNDMNDIDGHKGNDKGDDEQPGIEEPQIEENLLSIIKKIKKDTNRAGVQNIHTFINRRGINIGQEDVRKVIENLISRYVIIDKGKQGKESFFVLDLASEGEEIISDVTSDSEHVSNLNALQDFIDEKFYITFVNKIKSEVKLALNDSRNLDFIQDIKHNNRKEMNKMKARMI